MSSTNNPPSSRPMTLRQLANRIRDAYTLTEAEDLLTQFCQEIAREARSGRISEVQPQPTAIEHQVATLVAELELPWPTNVFGEVGDDDWPKINEWAQKELGYSIDRISGTLMRRGWRVFRRQLLERVSDLADTDLEAMEKLVESAKDELTHKPQGDNR